jgi:hypothetical protein
MMGARRFRENFVGNFVESQAFQSPSTKFATKFPTKKAPNQGSPIFNI